MRQSVRFKLKRAPGTLELSGGLPLGASHNSKAGRDDCQAKAPIFHYRELLHGHPRFGRVPQTHDRLTSAVTDAIQMARIEAGQIELRNGPRSIAEMVRQSLSKLAGSLDARPVAVRVSTGLPPVAADPELVHIVIRRLLDNAIKYSPPDSPISIEASLEHDAVVVSVADCGPGVAEPDRNRVFEKFYRGREARERIPGTGMGLAIARQIVLAHNGEIRVESRSGAGSRFRFSLPVAKEAAVP